MSIRHRTAAIPCNHPVSYQPISTPTRGKVRRGIGIMTRATLISDLWEPIQKYIGALNTRSMPAVHHYTSVKGALGILDSGQMWFTERAHLNDPSEISHGIDLAKSILCAKGRSYDATRLDALKGYFTIFVSSAQALSLSMTIFHSGGITRTMETEWCCPSRPLHLIIHTSISVKSYQIIRLLLSVLCRMTRSA